MSCKITFESIITFREYDLLLILHTSTINVEFYSFSNTFYFIILCYIQQKIYLFLWRPAISSFKCPKKSGQQGSNRHLKVRTLKVKNTFYIWHEISFTITELKHILMCDKEVFKSHEMLQTVNNKNAECTNTVGRRNISCPEEKCGECFVHDRNCIILFSDDFCCWCVWCCCTKTELGDMQICFLSLVLIWAVHFVCIIPI